MQTLIERGCGLDVHQATVVACLLMVRRDGKVQKQMRTFGTTTRELVGLREWLLSEGCTHVAMESTGVYWKPIYAILEGALEIVVANAQHIKKVPGRKTDVKDAEWIADLLCHGLLRSSFVPPKPIRELRDLMRYRRKLVESQAAERNRLLKVLETANIKLANVATDVFGMSGRLMLRALIAGKATPQEMAELAKGLLRKKIPELELALEGKLEQHHRFLLELQLQRRSQSAEPAGRTSTGMRISRSDPQRRGDRHDHRHRAGRSQRHPCVQPGLAAARPVPQRHRVGNGDRIPAPCPMAAVAARPASKRPRHVRDHRRTAFHDRMGAILPRSGYLRRRRRRRARPPASRRRGAHKPAARRADPRQLCTRLPPAPPRTITRTLTLQ